MSQSTLDLTTTIAACEARKRRLVRCTAYTALKRGLQADICMAGVSLR